MKNNSEKSRKTSTTMTTTTPPPSKKGKNKSSGSSGSSSSGSGSGSGSNSEKPKQPQRGLGVAQLEKIRLHTQLASRGIIPPHPVGFLNSPYQHAPEDIRYQLEYQASLQQQPPPPPPPPLQPQPQPFYYPPSAIPPPYGYHHQPNNAMMGMRDNMERANNMGYAESHFRNTARWNPNNNGFIIPENNPNTHQPGMITRHLLSHVERPESNKIFESERANNENAEPSANDELDLELKL